MFNPAAFSDIAIIKSKLAGSFILIENALNLSVAEELYSALNNFDNWRNENESIFQGKTPSDYTYNRLSIGMADEAAPQPVKSLYSYLNSRQVLDLVKTISNRECQFFSGHAVAYKNGHYIKSHNDLYAEKSGDEQITTRSVTFNYFLTKDWKQEWGGQFIWNNPFTVVNPTFNTLAMFLVGPDSHHHVSPVQHSSDNTRLVITGWFYTIRKTGSNHRKLHLDFL